MIPSLTCNILNKSCIVALERTLQSNALPPWVCRTMASANSSLDFCAALYFTLHPLHDVTGSLAPLSAALLYSAGLYLLSDSIA